MLVLAALCGAAGARAATYGCVGADGRTTFSDRPCPASATDSARREAGAEGYASARHGVHQEAHALAQEGLALEVDHPIEAGENPRPLDRAGDSGQQRGRGQEGPSVQTRIRSHDGSLTDR